MRTWPRKMSSWLARREGGCGLQGYSLNECMKRETIGRNVVRVVVVGGGGRWWGRGWSLGEKGERLSKRRGGEG